MMPRTRNKVIKWSVVGLLIAAGVVYFAVRRSAADNPVVFKTEKIGRGAVEQVVTATGQLNAVVTVQVGSQVSGIIQKLYADFNSQVKEGQVIAQIDPTRIKANLDQANAALKNAQASTVRARVNHDQAKRNLDRAQALIEKQVIGAAEQEEAKARVELAQVELASSEAQVAQARANVASARVDLERTTIKAPIDGTVLQRAVDVGQTVAASLQAPTIFTIAQDLSKMEVRAAIDEADVGKLREGLDARFTVDAHPGREFVATIHQIRSNPNVQQNVVTYDAILRVDNPEGRLRPGMTANVRIVCERRDNVLRVPNAALRFKPPSEMVLADQSGGGPGGAGRPAAAGDGGAPLAGGPGGERRRGAGGPGGGGWQGRRGGGGGPDGMRMGRRGGEGGGGPGAGGGPQGRVFARVYKPAGEKVQTVSFRAGIADDEWTEVIGGRLTQGDEVVVDASGGAIQQAAPRPPGGNAMRGRGPRLF
jgi:HlyD family secretion protein